MSETRTVIISATGHENVSAAHASTLEITSDDFLTPAGDCIVGIEADTVPAEFAGEFKKACQDRDAVIKIELEAGGHRDELEARGDPELAFESERSAVVRTSEYIDDRTVAVGADTAAGGIDRDLVDALSDGARLQVTITVD